MAATITVAQIQAIARMKDQLSPALTNIQKNMERDGHEGCAGR